MARFRAYFVTDLQQVLKQIMDKGAAHMIWVIGARLKIVPENTMVNRA